MGQEQLCGITSGWFQGGFTACGDTSEREHYFLLIVLMCPDVQMLLVPETWHVTFSARQLCWFLGSAAGFPPPLLHGQSSVHPRLRTHPSALPWLPAEPSCPCPSLQTAGSVCLGPC